MGIPNETLRAFRRQRHLSQTQVAEVAGVTQQLISDVESGDANLSYDQILRLVAYYSVTPRELGYVVELAPAVKRSAGGQA